MLTLPLPLARSAPHAGAADAAPRIYTIGYWALVVHAGASLLSAVSFATFLIEPYPAFINTPTNLKLLSFGLTWGGQITVVLGAIAGLAFAAWVLGVRTALLTFAVTFVLSLGAELAGTHWGVPFGNYAYSGRLGYKILDLVPFNIPASWFYMIVGCLAICARLLPAKDDGMSRWWWAFVSGLALTAWDVSLDPAMVKTYHWMWNVPDLSGAPAWQRFIGEPIFFGMPITNWLGWLLTGTLVSRAALMVVPPTRWAAALKPWKFPLVLYGVNGLLPLAICYRQEMVLAGVVGTIVMGWPLWAAWRKAD
ncbi:MAG: carotenoid biosynthesis protein [Gemmatimonadaceae bacterium]|nr:carotenoid biosynthesis protein [Gemmatimonadaceae bacterium]